MAKSKIVEKIERKHSFSIEGILNVDELQEGSFICEVEDEGEYDMREIMSKFNGELIKISIVKKDEEETEE
ncbi:hypothetical protein QTH25_13015 [Clostridium perfringens]|uniref:hypothetical protein n=1 Tax=Clostridium perfringens TaxID=1502 RepID=UPI00338EE80F|nr:hypothetical protein [Clostridium perfringens]